MVGVLVTGLLILLVLPSSAMAQPDGRCYALLPDTDPDRITHSSLNQTPFTCELKCFVQRVTTFCSPDPETGEQVCEEVPGAVVSIAFEVDDCWVEPVIRELNGQSRTEMAPELVEALDVLEADAIQSVIDEHGLPNHDLSRVSRILNYGRGEVRARLFALIYHIAEKDPIERSPNEQLIAEAYAQQMQNFRAEAVMISIEEYEEWATDPCGYVPPEGFAYDPDPGNLFCGKGFSLIEIFANVLPPSIEEFLSYGVAEAKRPILGDEGLVVTGEMGQATDFLATGGALGLGVIGGVVGAAVIGAAFQILFPTTALLAIKGTASAILGIGAAAAGAALAIVLAIVIGVTQGIYIFVAAEIPDQLAEALAQAQNSPPALVETLSTPRGQDELFTTFVMSTLPDFSTLEPAPPAITTDARFLVSEPGSNTEVVSPSISFLSWPEGPNPWTVRPARGWFAAEGNFNGETISTLSLYIDYLAWDGTPWRAWRSGDRFYRLPKYGDPEIDGKVTEELLYLDENNQPKIAKLLVDHTAPQLTPVVVGVPGANGWYVSDVSVSWNVVEPESSLLSLTGCEDSEVTADGVSEFDCTAESYGGANSESVTVRRDASPPNIAGSTNPGPNVFGWHKSDVSVIFTCDSFLPSGINTSAIGDGCGPNATVSAETDGMEVVGTATDKAGNTATDAVLVKLDKTPPTVDSTLTPAPNAAGWNNESVSLSFECEDALSGVLFCPPATVFSQEGQFSFPLQIEDFAGNATSASPSVNIDKTPPTIIPSVFPDANAAGWHKTDVIVAFVCDDNLSGLHSCTNGGVLTANGVGQSFPGNAQDVAGNVNSATVSGINIDKDPPTIVGSALPAPNAAGWNNVDVTVSFQCADGLSGIASCAPDAVLGEGMEQSRSGTAFDIAGNQAMHEVGNINVDKTPPAVAINTPPAAQAEYLLNEQVLADWSASDALSGISSSTATLPNGNPLPTGLVGQYAFEVQATDLAGNVSTLVHDYIVLTPTESLLKLDDEVQAGADQGAINSKDAQGLAKQLDSVIKQLGKDKLSQACKGIDKFVSDVESMIPDQVDAEAGSDWIASAQAIASTALGCP